MTDLQVPQPPDETISSLAFSPSKVSHANFLVAGSWDSSVRCWEINKEGDLAVAKAMQLLTGPVLDVAWNDDGSQVFMAGCNQMALCWDLNSNQSFQVAVHDGPIKACHWIKAANLSCLMTGSWDKTLKFWDLRQARAILTLDLPDRCYCADVHYPFAVIGTAVTDCLLLLRLDTGGPIEQRKIDLIRPRTTKENANKDNFCDHHRCLSIFENKDGIPSGFATGTTKSRVFIQHFNALLKKEDFSFRCHHVDTNITNEEPRRDVYAVNDVKFHPQFPGLFATCGSDGSFSYWNKDARGMVKKFERFNDPITASCFNHDGHIFAYSSGYDWSKGHLFNDPSKKPRIFIRPCFEEMKHKV